MTWVRLDENAPHHPKLLRAGPEAAWLWACGLAYCNRQVTDGVIPSEALAALYQTDEWPKAKVRKLAAKLVEVGLWTVRDEGGWSIHDYETYQREAMREAVTERREWEANRKAIQRAAAKERAKTQQPKPGDSSGLGALSHRDRGGTGVGHSPGTQVGHGAGTPVGQPPFVDASREASADSRPGLSQGTDPTRPDPYRPSPNTPPSPPRGGQGVREEVRLSTAERLGHTAAELVSRLTQSRPRGLSLGIDSVTELELQHCLDDITQRGTTPADLVTLTDWYAAGGLAWRQYPIPLRKLSADLADHVAQATEWHRQGRRPIAHDATPSGPRRPASSAPQRPPLATADEHRASADRAAVVDPLDLIRQRTQPSHGASK